VKYNFPNWSRKLSKEWRQIEEVTKACEQNEVIRWEDPTFIQAQQYIEQCKLLSENEGNDQFEFLWYWALSSGIHAC
jgi:hypothetical protein